MPFISPASNRFMANPTADMTPISATDVGWGGGWGGWG